MTDKALEAALKAFDPMLFGDDPTDRHMAASPYTVEAAQAAPRMKMQAAISAYLSALPGEAEVVAWRVKDYADGWILLHTEVEAKVEAENGNLIQPLVTLASLQAMQARAAKAEEANKALMDERTNIIETKRQQIEALTSRADKAEREYEKVLNSYADENQRLSNAAEAAEQRGRKAGIEEAAKLAETFVTIVYAHWDFTAVTPLEQKSTDGPLIAAAIRSLGEKI